MVRDRQLTLDVVRGIAILLVLMFHLRLATGNAMVDAALLPIVDAGWAGVDLFFVLSGFLVGRLILVEAASPAGFSRRRFMVRRVLRLWPVLFLYLAMLVLIGGADGVLLVLPVVFHVQNYAWPIPSHLWSLAVEEQFYLVAALVLPVLLIGRGPAAVGRALVAVIVASLVLRMGAWASGVVPQHLQWQTQYRADSIAAGVLIAWIELYRPDWLDRLTRHRIAAFAVALGGYAILTAATTNRFRFGPGLIAADVASVALVLAVHRAAIPAWLAAPARALAALGAIAYPLYIWHSSLLHVADTMAPMLGLTGPLTGTALRYALSVAVATLVAVTVERPMMRLRDRPRTGATANPCLVDY